MKIRVISKIMTLGVVSASLGLLSGCDSLGGPKQTTGTVVGGIGGALIGSQFGGGSGQVFATGLGAVAGAMAGGAIGKGMDDQYKYKKNK
ncbi:MAG: glycine zipper 2TM domain-containing protein [Gammaproteobacteria bacterium]